MESSRYQPPVKRSLSDEELAKKVNEATASHNGMEAVMDLLVAQEALRSQEEAELEAWIEQMEAEGTPEALSALAKFQGRVYVEPAAQEQPLIEVEPTPSVEDASEAEPFSWFSKAEDEQPATSPSETEPETVIEIVEVVEGFSPEEELAPVGSETPTDFERLLTAASAEEEATALEDDDVVVQESSNLVVPSDEHRNRKPISQLLAWLGASSVIAPLILSLALLGFGISTQVVLIDLAIGFLISGALIATASLAGKRSGLSTPIISRAVFGVWGNSFPLSLVTIARLILTAVILSVLLLLTDGIWTQLLSFDSVLTNQFGIKVTAGYLYGLALLAVVLGVALFRGKTSRILLLILSLGSFFCLLVSTSGVIQQPLSFTNLGSIGFASKESLAAIALVVAVQLLLWVEIAPNLSKAIPMQPRGLKVFFSVLGAQGLLPVAIAVLAVAFISPSVAAATRTVELGPIPGLVGLLPNWASIFLVVSVASALIYAAVLNLKSLSLDLIALVRLKSRVAATLISTLLVALIQLWIVQQPELRTVEYLINISVLAGVLTAGWIGMFIADVGVRKIAYHELSLNRSYGFYGRFNPISLSIWFVCLVVAILIVPVNLMGLEFMGYFAANLGLDESLASQALAICLVAFSGMLLTVAARIPQIRKQEKEVLAVESRREQLNDIFIGQD